MKQVKKKHPSYFGNSRTDSLSPAVSIKYSWTVTIGKKYPYCFSKHLSYSDRNRSKL